MGRCASCDLTLAAGQLRAQAAILDALERPDEALAARTEAERLDGLGCSWWWRRKTESIEPDPATGQHTETIVEECGKLSLPHFLSDFGWSTRLSAKSVQTATAEAGRAADGACATAGEIGNLRAAVDRQSDRLEGVVDGLARRLEERRVPSRRSLGARVRGLLR